MSESSTVRTQFFNALDRYLPESNVNYQSSINVAVDFVQDGVSVWEHAVRGWGLC